MEVHPPHAPVQSWREALIHIGLMTIGLFIALSMEGLIEYAHHKELVRQARENIRRELEDNHKAAQENLKHLKDNEAKLQAGLSTLRFLRQHPDAQNQTISFTMNYSDLSDAAWRTARDTAALGYMPYDEVQRYSGLYGLQSSLSGEASQLLQRQAETLAPIIAAGEDFKSIPPGQYDEMLRSTASNLMDVTVIEQFMKALDQQYISALKQH